ncbi:MAG: ABC transporter permease [Candidatus Dormiibacterota bacterium]
MNPIQFIFANWDTLGPQVVTHIEIVVISMAVAGVLGLLLGVAAARWNGFARVVLAVTSTILTVPSFALFGLLSIYLGLGNPPVIAGLILYALLPIVRNTRTGIAAVAPAVTEAARSMGMHPGQVLTRVELPLAAPVILAGLRQATVMIVAIATVGATVGANDLGQPILEAVGRSSGSTLDHVLAGIIPVALLGLLADAILAAMQRMLARGRTGIGVGAT